MARLQIFAVYCAYLRCDGVPSGFSHGRRGTHGFVQLAIDTRSNTQVAIKFIPRDQKMQTKSILRCVSSQPCGCRPKWPGYGGRSRRDAAVRRGRTY